MADEKITMSIAAMSRTMANAVLRERRRCAQLVRDHADIVIATTGGPLFAQSLHELAETIMTPPGVQVVPSPEGQTGTAAPDPEVPTEDDGLPPVRHGDDGDDGIALARNLMRRAPGADFASGGGIGRD